MTTLPRRLGGIEALRGLAAVSVILYHVSRHVDQAFGAPGLVAALQPGHAGVDLFFVISGFIILFVHRADLGRPRRLGHYLARRATRVLPLYWAALAVTIGMALAAERGWPDAAALLRSVLLLPFGEPLLGVAWTLQYEAVFYLLFAAMILSRPAGALLMAGWFAWVAAAALGLAPASAAPPDGAYALQFAFGMAAAWLAGRGELPAPRLLAAGGALAFGAAMLAEGLGRLDGYGDAARLAYGLPAALLLLGLAGAERQGGLAVPGWLRHLGGASYAMYLFQFVFIGVAWQAWRLLGLGAALPAWACFAALSAAAILGGLATSWLVEKPLLRWMRRPPGGGA